VRPLALTHHQGRAMLVLEDSGGEPLARLLGTPLELGLFLRVAAGLAAALGQLHSRGLIHKDLKPAHVLVNSATGQVWLMGFGIASRLPRERQAPEPPEFIAGTLRYMAPEQTGRMNRSVDARSDLYALGVMLYEMLTGSLPFTASDPMEWVHCHIARRPVPPAERLKEVPPVVSAIIMKLLAKTAEDRYQTAAALESDLRRCLAAWEAQRRIADFPLGAHDTPDRLLTPEKLYGRSREVETLLAAFDRVVKGGTPELVLVSGYAGIGKSSVVNELHKVLVPPHGLFASGKFDQYKRDIPYATLAQAFQTLIQPLLGKSDAELAGWRHALREALGPNGRLMVDLVPELKLIIGEQPPVPELPPQDAQRRFQLVFRRLIGVFARPDHPLALFLDDLQWLHAATLDLVEDLLTQPDVQYLMLIGAYRDNQVSSIHPLRRKLEAIRNAGAIVQEITLVPLAREDLGRSVADALRCEPARAAPLAQLVHEKTAGNPFFAIQFISALAEEGLLTFDHDAARWCWDLNHIHAKAYTDNVVDLMVGKLNRLPVETQTTLQQLAYLGNIAEITMLSIVLGVSEEQVHADLWEAVRLELVERLAGSYKFVHDRVQEAAYSLIPEASRAEAHLRIGRLLAAQTPMERREEAIFDIVNQFNRGAALITSRDEREQLAELNLIAGQRAKASAACGSALNYLTAGAALLPDDAWECRHELTFELELHRAECEFLTGAMTAAEPRLAALSIRAASTIERAFVACLRADLYTALGQSSRAVGVGLDYLQHLGGQWSPHPTDDEVRCEYERICSQLESRTIEDLVELPLMIDPASLATIDVLTKIGPPAFFTEPNLWSLAICWTLNLSLERGNSDGSCLAYIGLGLIAGKRFGDYKAAFRFGEVGYELVERLRLKRFQPRIYLHFGAHLMPCTRHVRFGRDLLRRAFEIANKNGDLIFAGYSCATLIENLLAAGDSLVEVQREAEHGLEFALKMRFGFAIDSIAAQLGLIRTLRGSTPKFGCFDDEQFDERRMERRFSSNPELALPEGRYWMRKLQARFFAGDYASALEASERAQRLLWTLPSMFETADYHFYGAPSQAASCESGAAGQQRQHVEALVAHHRQLQVWAENCLENFENRAALVGAEIARIEGRALDAMDLYEQAIRSARTHGFVHNEALANELAARFYAARGFEQIAHLYLRNARHGYLRWGADGKGGNSRRSIRISGRQRRCLARRARSRHQSTTWTSPPCSKSRKPSQARSSWRNCSTRSCARLLRMRVLSAGCCCFHAVMGCGSRRKRPPAAARSRSVSATRQSPALTCRSRSFNMPRVHRRASSSMMPRLGARSPNVPGRPADAAHRLLDLRQPGDRRPPRRRPRTPGVDPGAAVGGADGAGGRVVAGDARLGRLRRDHQHELCHERDDPQHVLGHGAFPPDLWRRDCDHVFRHRLRDVAAHHRQAAALQATGALAALAVVRGDADHDDPLAHRRADGAAATRCHFRLQRTVRRPDGTPGHHLGDRRARPAQRGGPADRRARAFALRRAVAGGAAAQQPEKKVLSLEAARKMVAAAIGKAERNHWRGVVAVVDDGGWLILLERMDRAARTALVELAAGKARAAALFKKPSQELEEAINRGRYAAITARGFIEMQGALPVVVDGEVIGAIGASFATPEQDVQVAQAGLAALAQ
jgi:predicted ATPase/uncharacterized protein GlcG (DUF336 family)